MTEVEPSAVQRLLEACADYFETVMGRPPADDEAHALLTEGPEDGVAAGDKMLVAIRAADDGDLVGVLDAFADYPAPGVWYIGLLLFAPSARRAGFGRAVLDALVRHAASRGAHEMQINVVEQNQAALQFWARCGFAELRRWTQTYGRRTSTFIRMSLTL